MSSVRRTPAKAAGGVASSSFGDIPSRSRTQPRRSQAGFAAICFGAFSPSGYYPSMRLATLSVSRIRAAANRASAWATVFLQQAWQASPGQGEVQCRSVFLPVARWHQIAVGGAVASLRGPFSIDLGLHVQRSPKHCRALPGHRAHGRLRRQYHQLESLT